MHKSTQLCLNASVYKASPYVLQPQAHSVCKGTVSIFCISGHMTASRSIATMGSHPIGHIVLYGQHRGRVEWTGNTLESGHLCKH